MQKIYKINSGECDIMRKLIFPSIALLICVLTGCSAYQTTLKFSGAMDGVYRDRIKYQENVFFGVSTIAFAVSYPQEFSDWSSVEKDALAYTANKHLFDVEEYLHKNIPEIEVYNIGVLDKIVKHNKALLRSSKRFDGVFILFPSQVSVYAALYKINRDGQLSLLKEGRPQDFMQEFGSAKEIEIRYDSAVGERVELYNELQKKFGGYATKVFSVLADYADEFGLKYPVYPEQLTPDNLPDVTEDDIRKIAGLAKEDIKYGDIERAMNVFIYLYDTFKIERYKKNAEIAEFLLEKTDIGFKNKKRIERQKQKLSIK